MPSLSPRLQSLLPAGKNGWELHFNAVQRKEAGQDIIIMTAGDHDFPTPSPTVDGCIRALMDGHHHYTPLNGQPRLRQAMAALSSQTTGIATTDDQILATTGGQGALFAAIQATLDTGDHGLLIGPYYATYPATLRSAGAMVDVVAARPDNGFQPTAQDIDAALTPRTRVLLINSPNNPTGAVYTPQTLEMIADICRRHDLWLISDEVYWSMADGHHLSPRSLPGMADRTLVVNSLSKSHGMTGWRIGWLTGPAAVIQMLIGLNLVSTYGLPDFSSHAATLALENSIGITEIATRYSHRRQVVRNRLHGHDRLHLRGSDGAIYMMVDISAITSDDEAFAWALLDQEHLAVMPGSSFGAEARSHIRLSLAQPDQILAEGIDRLIRFTQSRPNP